MIEEIDPNMEMVIITNLDTYPIDNIEIIEGYIPRTELEDLETNLEVLCYNIQVQFISLLLKLIFVSLSLILPTYLILQMYKILDSE